jgi:hypothetical protein
LVPITVTVDGKPKCVVRANDMKHLQRFLRNAKSWLLADAPEGALAHREADAVERAIWENARGLHCIAGGEDEEFFGTPL